MDVSKSMSDHISFLSYARHVVLVECGHEAVITITGSSGHFARLCGPLTTSAHSCETSSSTFM